MLYTPGFYLVISDHLTPEGLPFTDRERGCPLGALVAVDTD